MRPVELCRPCAIVLVLRGVCADVVHDVPTTSGYDITERPEEWPRKAEQHLLNTIILQTTTTSSYPKITQAPVWKRKLGSRKWDVIHEGIQGRKRDAVSCGVDYQLCPQSLKGGCCPNDRICGTSSCYASSAAPASACGKSGYIACGIEDGGGCCPSNYVCGRLGCSPEAGVSHSETCGVSSYLCPESLGFGCCKNGMGCGLTNCYSTEVVTLTITEALVTTEDGQLTTMTNTIVTTVLPDKPTAVLSLKQSGVLPKETAPVESAIAKTKPSRASSSGLSKAQLGGIIAAAVVLLVISLIISFFIMKRLNNVKRIVEENSRNSSSTPRSRQTRQQISTPTTDLIDAMSIDPLIMSASEVSRSAQNPSHPSAVHSSHHEVDASSPPAFQSPFSPRSPPSYSYGNGYAPVAMSDTSSTHRNASVDSTPGIFQSPTGYFDITKPELRDQNLRFGHSPGRWPSRHERQWSESEQSQVSLASSGRFAELDSGADSDQRSGLQNVVQGIGLGIGRLWSRRKSSNPLLTPQKTSELLTGVGSANKGEWPLGPLGHIAEAGESRLDIQEIGSGKQFRDSMLMQRQAFSRLGEQAREHDTNDGKAQKDILADVDL